MIDAQALYDIVADDSVWPSTGAPSRPTLAQVAAALQTVSEVHIMPEGGFVALFAHKDDPTVADVHSGFLPRVRGAAALHFCRELVQRVPYKRLVTTVKEERARVFAKMVGFRQEGNVMVLTKE